MNVLIVKRFLLPFLILIFLALPYLSAAEAPVSLTAYLFYGSGCPHCAKEEVFLQTTVREKYPNVEIKSFEVYFDSRNASLLNSVAQTLGVKVGGVPFLVIGDKYFVGYAEGITGKEIEHRIQECLKSGCPDSVAGIVSPETMPIVSDSNASTNGESATEKSKIITMPILGEIDVYKFSLPALTVVLGISDGFNPCAMWTLLFLISLLLGMKNRRRMWILGLAFIATSALVYFIFMAAWLNLILFLGFIIWVRITIGVLALAGGGYSIKEFFTNKANVCKVSDGKRQQRVFDKLKAVIEKNSFLLALSGVIGIAFLVNLVELICSAGLPAVYTQVLTLSELSAWQYYLYLLIYIFFYMLDDLFVFVVAMVTLQVTGMTTKYTKYSHLIGGVIMVVIGILLLFKPQLLMFG